MTRGDTDGATRGDTLDSLWDAGGDTRGDTGVTLGDTEGDLCAFLGFLDVALFEVTEKKTKIKHLITLGF